MKIRTALIIPPTLLLAISALLSRGLGVVRDHLLAKTFGATAGTGLYDLDAYYAAFRIPDLIYNLLIFGAISSAFIPLFTQYKKKGDMENAWAFSSGLLHILFLGTLVISGVAYLFAPLLAKLVAAGFHDEKLALTIRLLRLMLLSPILMSLSAIFISLQDSFKSFFWRSLSPLFYNAGIILGIVWWGQSFGVVGVTWGVILGAFLQLALQIPALIKIGYKHIWTWGHQRTDVKKALKLMVPRVLGLACNQMTIVIDTMVASFLGTGSIAIIFLADNLQALPLGMIGISYAITSFATLSELAAEPTLDRFSGELKRVTHKILFLIIPATFGMIILKNEIVSVVLRSGKFTQGDANLTAKAMSIMVLALFAGALIPVFARAFHAFHDTRTPLKAAIWGALVNIGFSPILGLYFKWGISGILSAYVLGTLTNFFILYFYFNRKLKLHLIKLKDVIKIIFISMLMATLVYLLKIQVPFEGVLLLKIGLLILYSGVGAGFYFGLSYITRRF